MTHRLTRLDADKTRRNRRVSSASAVWPGIKRDTIESSAMINLTILPECQSKIIESLLTDVQCLACPKCQQVSWVYLNRIGRCDQRWVTTGTVLGWIGCGLILGCDYVNDSITVDWITKHFIKLLVPVGLSLIESDFNRDHITWSHLNALNWSSRVQFHGISSGALDRTFTYLLNSLRKSYL